MITIHPQTEQEEKELLEFLQKNGYNYIIDDDSLLTVEQQQEILRRDELYEKGEMKSYSLDELKDHFNIQKG